ncbi:MAG: MliC family protein [Roseobacter sp.]|jgi:uncharacterized protein|nr:MliC family protein [Roseobacter sp.]
MTAVRTFFFSGLIAGAASTALALAGPSFDCEKAGSDAEVLICVDDALAALDQRMAERFAATLAAINMLDTGKEEALTTTRATQRGWIKGRDDCWKAQDLRACVEAAYLLREAELVATWLVESPASVHSYFCEGDPANFVTAYFFDTEQRAIRLAYRDSIRTGALVPAASGAKYETSFGGMFWTKGADALFEWTAGTEMYCRQGG